MKPTATTTLLYDKVVKVTDVYLGPAAHRFIDRQVEYHLHKPPKTISRQDLLKLIDWIKVAVSLLSDDHELVEEYAAELQKLVEPKTKPKHKRPS